MSEVVFSVQFNEDGSATCLARLMAEVASGSALSGMGYWCEGADFTSITCKVFDVTNDNTEITPAPTVTVGSVIIDSPVTDGILWSKDSTGYNFKHRVSGTYFPEGGRRYRVAYFATMTDGETYGWSYEGVARPRAGG